ncbi:hypothetical protein BKA62DRAFT_674120 [Auriculariales sp. MPI-PUGE-AT-0066]|nr:hypothetical protein BKA62DRAFT_674120 [Auriculariales sp. MPI-PUGE-AT-0066]
MFRDVSDKNNPDLFAPDLSIASTPHTAAQNPHVNMPVKQASSEHSGAPEPRFSGAQSSMRYIRTLQNSRAQPPPNSDRAPRPRWRADPRDDPFYARQWIEGSYCDLLAAIVVQSERNWPCTSAPSIDPWTMPGAEWSLDRAVQLGRRLVRCAPFGRVFSASPPRSHRRFSGLYARSYTAPQLATGATIPWGAAVIDDLIIPPHTVQQVARIYRAWHHQVCPTEIIAMVIDAIPQPLGKPLAHDRMHLQWAAMAPPELTPPDFSTHELDGPEHLVWYPNNFPGFTRERPPYGCSVMVQGIAVPILAIDTLRRYSMSGVIGLACQPMSSWRLQSPLKSVACGYMLSVGGVGGVGDDQMKRMWRQRWQHADASPLMWGVESVGSEVLSVGEVDIEQECADIWGTVGEVGIEQIYVDVW